MNIGSAEAKRLCLVCSAGDLVKTGEPVWPLGWHCPACGHGLTQAEGIPMFAPTLADTISGFDPASFATLAQVEATHFWFVPRNELIVGLANRFFPNARSYLEVGCGNGTVLRALVQSRRWERVVGSDLHPTGLAYARARLPRDVEFVQMNATMIPATNAFDLIGAFDVVEHIADDEAVLRSLRQATTKYGGAIIAVPQHPWLWSRADEIGHHQRRYRHGELETKLRRNGFHVLFSSSYTAVLLPLMIASRIKTYLAPGDRDIEREFSLWPVANTALKAILRIEVRLTLAGVQWAAGGSRIVVVRAV